MFSYYRSTSGSRVIRSGAVAVVFSLGMFGALLAHGALKTSSPKAGDHLGAAPRELRLTFTEAPELALTRIELRGPDSQVVTLGALRAVTDSSAVVIAPIVGGLVSGTYIVSWQIAGADGHPVRDNYSFVIAPGASGLLDPNAPGAVADTMADSSGVHHDPVSMPTSSNGFDAESAGYVIIRFLFYTALLIVVGAVAFRFAVLGLLRRRADVEELQVSESGRRAAMLGWYGAWLLLFACLARLVAQSVALHGGAGPETLPLVSTLITGTGWGRSWLVQFGATLLALGAFAGARRRADGRGAGWVVAGVAALILAFTPAFASHAAASMRLTPLAILLDGLHVTGASGWLGSLFIVLAAGIPVAMALPEERRGPAVANLINAFSPTALVFAGLVAGTGLFAAWLHVGGFAPLWQQKYGQLLLAKLAVLSVVALTGAYNWLRVRPALGDVEGAARIQKSARVEVAVAVMVLIITAILVATPTPMDPM